VRSDAIIGIEVASLSTHFPQWLGERAVWPDSVADAQEEFRVHELSVCQALLQEVAKVAVSRGACAVERITVEVGRLSGVEPELLARAFEVARLGTCASQAVLIVEALGITVSCTECGATSRVEPNRLVCAACSGYRTRIVEGDELRLRAIELQVPEARAALPVDSGVGSGAGL
jgi:hydrogenase nickel incorporation protein HypA/HybF